MSLSKGYSWKMKYSGYPPQPDEEIFRCQKCVDEYGVFCSGYKDSDGYVEPIGDKDGNSNSQV